MLKETIKIGDKSYIKANVVMLATNKKANKGELFISICEPLEDLLQLAIMNGCRHNSQHLYIISNEEIKEGDWFLTDHRDNIHQNNGNPIWVLKQCTSIFNKWICADNHEEVGYNPDWSKKIIATTDENLVVDNCTPFAKLLPQPSQQFIEKYIKEYNKGNIITDVLVECEIDYNITCHISGKDCLKYRTNTIDCKGCIKAFYKLKVNSKDNTITIIKQKYSWNRNEVIKLLLQFNNDKPGVFDCSKWIEDNL